ncbi:MAG: dihydroorotate dehydrogenase electron transfer subunit [Acidobacteriota bacterium]|nr:MAG: dihydroorotate dehydrogenase electron transfer subunit [Acidobacteriota bacterium]
MRLCYSCAVYSVEAVILESRKFAHGSCILKLRAPLIAREATPGQFLMAAQAEESAIPSPLLKRALAIFTVETEEKDQSLITLLIKTVGRGTRKLVELQPGQTLNLIGPLGNGFDLTRANGKITLLVVGGTGIASVQLLASALARRGEEVELIYGGRSAEDLVGLAEFEHLGIPITTSTEDGSQGVKGLVTEALLQRIEQLPVEHLNLYTCGPNPMMEAVGTIAEQHRIPCQISVEVKMGCGFGVCLGCTVKTSEGYRLACTHGPVFDASEFVWEHTRREATTA